MAGKKYYTVWKGVNPGIYDSWTDCQLQIKGFKGALYKSFKTREEAEHAFASPAHEFMAPPGRKNGERKNGYHKAIYLGSGKFCWPIEHVVAWSLGPIAKHDVNANGIPVVWHKRDASEPPGSIDVLVLCTFLTKQLHWSVSRFNEAKKEWSIEKKQASVEFWAEIPEMSGEAKTLF